MPLLQLLKVMKRIASTAGFLVTLTAILLVVRQVAAETRAEVIDSAGNSAVVSGDGSALYVQLTTNSLISDTIPPTITLIGEVQLELLIGSVFTDPGATAVDDVDGDITDQIMVAGIVQTDTLGTYTLTYQVSDTAGNLAQPVTRTVEVIPHSIYAPLVSLPWFNGEVGISSSRHREVTTFISDATIDFSQLGFPREPQFVRIWAATMPEPTSWVPYDESNVSIPIDDGQIGWQPMEIRFLTMSGRESPVLTMDVFYIPNGDFEDISTTGWTYVNEGLPVSLVDGSLRLGDDTLGCDNMPFPAGAIANLTMNLPDTTHDYSLYIDGVITTWDKIPNPTRDIWDAFEVYIDDMVIERFGYQGEELLGCDRRREVAVMTSFPLSIYGAEIDLSLRNYSRLDKFYNTYTDVSAIWVGKE